MVVPPTTERKNEVAKVIAVCNNRAPEKKKDSDVTAMASLDRGPLADADGMNAEYI